MTKNHRAAPANSSPLLPRRTVLQGISAAGALPLWASAADATPQATIGATVDWAAFDRSVRAAFDRLRLVGAAVAVVSSDQVLHTLTVGSRALSPRRPVTEDTVFLVASTTKPLTATMVATYVDDGTLAWDQPVVDAWPGFRPPTDELTRTLEVRDLLNMWSGIGRDAAADLHVTDLTASDVVRGLVNYPVIGPRHTSFFYNNDVYALGGYLPLLASGVALGDLGPAYAQAMRDRLFRPAGMATARMSTDPRGLFDDLATGYSFDLTPRATAIPYASNGGAAPAGQTVANVKDMAAWVRLQLRRGRSITGDQLVSPTTLAECWTPGWSQAIAPGTQGDLVTTGYGLGFNRDEYRGGTQVVWHNGALDGFTSYVGFLPQHDLGLVVLTNINFYPAGGALYTYVLNLLLEQRFGLNAGVTEQALAYSDAQLASLADLGRQSGPVRPNVVEPYLGYYEHGYSLVRDGGRLLLLVGPRRWVLAGMPDGGYVVAEGAAPGTRVRLSQEADGRRRLEIVDFETVRQVNRLS